MQHKIVEKSCAWYAYNGEKIGQGKDNAREYLRENADVAREIENKVRAALGVTLLEEAEKAPEKASAKADKAAEKAEKAAAKAAKAVEEQA